MTQTKIKGIDIDFPFVPYQVQIDYMSKVIECLQNRVNGILESPTGTGKTLCLLCSVLAWLETKKAQHQLLVLQHSVTNEKAISFSSLKTELNNVAGLWNSEASAFILPKIIYGSRTHTQLSQAMQELKRTNYKHVPAVVLGSRDHLCVHPEVSKLATSSAKLYACRSKVGSKTCHYHLNHEEKFMSIKEYQENPVMDIEDLVTLGKKHMFCPYYAAKGLMNKANVLFTPYNYIIDHKIRKAQGIELENNIVILDEAHNIDSVCEQSMSFQLRSVDLAMCINELTQTINMVKDNDQLQPSFSSSEESTPPDFTMNDLLTLKVMFCELESAIDSEMAQVPSTGLSKSGDYMLDAFSKVELTPQRRDVILELLDKISLYQSNISASSPWGPKGTGLQKIAEIVKIFYARFNPFSPSDFKKDLSVKYSVFLQLETSNKKNTGGWTVEPSHSSLKQGWKINCWCFSPEIGMQDVCSHGVHSILLTSGTLSPLPPLIRELGISFPVQLENPHVIKDKQVLVAAVTQGPDGSILNSSYQNRFSEKYINSLGRSIANFCRVIPNGVLVFFPSYSVMKGNVEKWEETGVWQSLSGVKPMFVEPQSKDAFQQSIEKFYASINDPGQKGAALLAVLRGKVSEGLDFADDNARAVLITGLPFPPWLDPHVKLKMAYLDNVSKDTNGLRGAEWYSLQASRAVNQAIGRVIRHKDDFGTILLCDNRFSEGRIQKQLSKWVQGRIQVFKSFGPALKTVSSFFKEMNGIISRPATKAMIGSFACNPQVSLKNEMFANGISSSNNARSSTSTSFKNERVDESLFQNYKGSPTNVSSSTKENPSKSIFDCFDQFMTTGVVDKNVVMSELKESSCNDSSEAASSTSSKDAKRRKINIQFRQADQSEAKSLDNRTDEREAWKSYLKEIKLILGASSLYAKFCVSVKEYKNSKDVEKFAHEIIEIFSTVTGKVKYLERISLIVTSQERRKFLTLCGINS